MGMGMDEDMDIDEDMDEDETSTDTRGPSPSAPSWQRGRYTVDTDPARVDVTCVQSFLATSYWARDIPLEIVERACRGSLCFGLYHESQDRARADAAEQVGFARVVTDRATFGYLADVFVLPPHRGRGLAGWLVECCFAHPDLQGLRRWMLATNDAHGLYERHGFQRLARPERFMEIARPDMYTRVSPTGSEGVTGREQSA